MAEEQDSIRSEADHIRRAALVGAERHYIAETTWYATALLIGIPATCLAAVAGAAAFKDSGAHAEVAGYMSLVTAILTALLTFLSPQQRAKEHHASAKAYEALYHAAGFFFRVESGGGIGTEEQLKRLRVLSETLIETNKKSPVVSARACRRSEQRLLDGRGEVVRDPADLPVKEQGIRALG